jgi:hypothetical protein
MHILASAPRNWGNADQVYWRILEVERVSRLPLHRRHQRTEKALRDVLSSL